MAASEQDSNHKGVCLRRIYSKACAEQEGLLLAPEYSHAGDRGNGGQGRSLRFLMENGGGLYVRNPHKRDSCLRLPSCTKNGWSALATSFLSHEPTASTFRSAVCEGENWRPSWPLLTQRDPKVGISSWWNRAVVR